MKELFDFEHIFYSSACFDQKGDVRFVGQIVKWSDKWRIGRCQNKSDQCRHVGLDDDESGQTPRSGNEADSQSIGSVRPTLSFLNIIYSYFDY